MLFGKTVTPSFGWPSQSPDLQSKWTWKSLVRGMERNCSIQMFKADRMELESLPKGVRRINVEGAKVRLEDN